MVRTAVELTAEELRTYRRTARLRGQRVRQGTVERLTESDDEEK